MIHRAVMPMSVHCCLVRLLQEDLRFYPTSVVVALGRSSIIARKKLLDITAVKPKLVSYEYCRPCGTGGTGVHSDDEGII